MKMWATSNTGIAVRKVYRKKAARACGRTLESGDGDTGGIRFLFSPGHSPVSLIVHDSILRLRCDASLCDRAAEASVVFVSHVLPGSFSDTHRSRRLVARRVGVIISSPLQMRTKNVVSTTIQ